MLADDDLDIYPEIIFIAENFDDLSARVRRCRRPFGDGNIDDQTFEIVPLATLGFRAEHAVASGARASDITMRPWIVFFIVREFGRSLGATRNDDVDRDLLIDRSHIVVRLAVMEDTDDA